MQTPEEPDSQSREQKAGCWGLGRLGRGRCWAKCENVLRRGDTSWRGHLGHAMVASDTMLCPWKVLSGRPNDNVDGGGNQTYSGDRFTTGVCVKSSRCIPKRIQCSVCPLQLNKLCPRWDTVHTSQIWAEAPRIQLLCLSTHLEAQPLQFSSL